LKPCSLGIEDSETLGNLSNSGLKAVSAREVRKEFPKVKDELWGGEFWEDGYFARTVGDEVTTEMITRYIQFHEEREKAPEQLKLI